MSIGKEDWIFTVLYLFLQTFYCFIDAQEGKTWFLQFGLEHPVEDESTGESILGGGAKETGPIY